VVAIRDRFGEGWLEDAVGAPPDVAGLLKVESDGHCVFHRPVIGVTAPGADAAARRCLVQHALGHPAMPSACQHFPRVCLIDRRGVFVTLSSYCPTVAALLFSETRPLAIVPGPDPLPGGAVEGLDASEVLPPLLVRDVLMDDPGLTAWEAHVVSWLGGTRNPDGRSSPEQTLTRLASHATRLERWRPGDRAIAAEIETIDAIDQPGEPGSGEPEWEAERELRQLGRQALPAGCDWPDDSPDLASRWCDAREGWRAHAPVMNRFLAGHAFASWTLYQGDGVRSHVRSVRLALAVLRSEVIRACVGDRAAVTSATVMSGIRQTDLLLMHLVDRTELAANICAVRW
jgi:hypothetical protein